MIAHVSIPAKDPKATALLVAKLIDGETFSFPPVPGAWIAVARDGSGVSVEVYPETMAHHPGKGAADASLPTRGPVMMPWEDQIYAEGSQVRPSAFHIALTTKLGAAEVVALARSAGLRAVECDRAGVFGLIEVWIDGSFLIEVLPEAEAKRYRAFMNPQGCAAMFGPAAAAV
jgi:hypothetical protein